jgi:hypothetical protein
MGVDVKCNSPQNPEDLHVCKLELQKLALEVQQATHFRKSERAIMLREIQIQIDHVNAEIQQREDLQTMRRQYLALDGFKDRQQ